MTDHPMNEPQQSEPIGGPLNRLPFNAGNPRIFVPDAPIVLSHPNDLVPGDRIIIGKRAWIYKGRSSKVQPDIQAQDEYVFESDPVQGDGPGVFGTAERIYSQSEVEAFALAGFVERMKWCKVNFNPDAKVVR